MNHFPMFQCEIWKPVPGFEAYEVSSHGRVRCYLSRTGKGSPKWPHYLKPAPPGQYKFVNFRSPDCQKRIAVHFLVASLFIGQPAWCDFWGPLEPNHLDGNKANNHADNLEWTDRSGNIQHAFDLGLSRSGEAHPNARRTVAEIKEMRHLRSLGMTQTSIADKFGTSQGSVSLIVRNKAWRKVL